MKYINFFIFIICLLSFLFLPTAIFAIGQITQPIVIDNALRGEVFQEILTVVNTEDKNTSFLLSVEGDIADWVKFYSQDDTNNPIEEDSMFEGKKLKIIAKFTIPTDAENGEYTGVLNVISKPDADLSEDQPSATISQKVGRNVKITVSDNEVIDLKASVIINKYALGKNEPLKIRIIYDNQGNVIMTPQAQLKIKKEGQSVYDVIFPYPENEPPIKPRSIYEIPNLEVQLNNLEDGGYDAELDFLYKGKSLFEKKFSFSLGTVSKSEDESEEFFWSLLLNKNLLAIVLAGLFLMIVILIIVKIESQKKKKNNMVLDLNNKKKNKSNKKNKK